MSIFSKKKKSTAFFDDGDDAEAIMKKYDKESNTRIWVGKPKLFVSIFMALFSLFIIYMTLFATPLPETKLSMFLGLIVILGYLNYPINKHNVKPNRMPIYDIILMVLGSGAFFYFAINATTILMLSNKNFTVKYVVIGLIGLLVLAELCRRCVGVPILCVAGALLIYTVIKLSSYDDGSAWVVLRTMVRNLFYTVDGVIGTPISVCYTFITLFIIFGAFLERTNIANFFIALANRIAGWSSGGPAKVAVISSALCGMVSGSSVGNTVTTGSVTIPMMKKTGYKPEFAGAVEASASTGGQIMPPIMGAAAFLMAEYMGIPYKEVAVKAILPAVLYFAGIFIAVHLEAKKLKLRGIDKRDLPKWSYLLHNIYLLLPLVLLVYLVSTNACTMAYAAGISIGAAFIIGGLNFLANDLVENHGKLSNGEVVKMSLKKTLKTGFDALTAGAKGTITVAVACAMAGIIAGCITMTGLASILINAIVQVAGNVSILGLFLTMLCCIVLGMGVPTTANYCIMAATCAPILIQLGIPKVAAHFFVFYFGIVADITPPVALAAYAGAAIAKSNPMKTGLNATKLAIAAFIVPYIFAYNPAMLFENSAWYDVIIISLTALAGLFGIAAALNGHLFTHIHPILRLLLVAGGLCMMIPGTMTDIIGLVAVGGITAFQYFLYKSARKA